MQKGLHREAVGKLQDYRTLLIGMEERSLA